MAGVADRFGAVLRELRTARGLTQEELAHRAGLTPEYIGLLERGKRTPTLLTIFRLAPPLAVAPSEIVRRVERRPDPEM